MLMKINEIVFLSNKNNREYKTILFFMVFKIGTVIGDNLIQWFQTVI